MQQIFWEYFLVWASRGVWKGTVNLEISWLWFWTLELKLHLHSTPSNLCLDLTRFISKISGTSYKSHDVFILWNVEFSVYYILLSVKIIQFQHILLNFFNKTAGFFMENYLRSIQILLCKTIQLLLLLFIAICKNLVILKGGPHETIPYWYRVPVSAYLFFHCS